jgi:hypothetical protein
LRVRVRWLPLVFVAAAFASLAVPRMPLALALFTALLGAGAGAVVLLHGGPSRLVEGELRTGSRNSEGSGEGLKFRRTGASRTRASEAIGTVVAVDLTPRAGVWDMTLFDRAGRSLEVRIAELERSSLLATIGLDGAPRVSQFRVRGPFGARGLVALGAALVGSAVLARLVGPRLDDGDRVAWALVLAAVVWAPVLVARVVQRVLRIGEDGVVVRGLGGARTFGLEEARLEAAGVFVQIFRGESLVETLECSTPHAAREAARAFDAWRRRRERRASAS